jgi:hypothetical protein
MQALSSGRKGSRVANGTMIGIQSGRNQIAPLMGSASRRRDRLG